MSLFKRFKFLFVLLLVAAAAKAQTPNSVPQQFNGRYYQFRSYVQVDSALMLPARDTSVRPIHPSVVFRSADSSLYYFDRVRWRKLGGGVSVESDPTVGAHIKALTATDTANFQLAFRKYPKTLVFDSATRRLVLTLNDNSTLSDTIQIASSGADNWGTQTVVTNSTLTGNGTSGSPLAVDTFRMTTNLRLKKVADSLSLAAGAADGNFYPTLLDLTGGVLTLGRNNLSPLTTTVSTTNVVEGSNLYFTTARARTSLSAGSGIGYNSSTGIITNTSPDVPVSITAGSNVTVSGTYPNFTISSTGGGEVNTASNLGASGARVFSQKSGVDLQFRRLIAGTNVTIVENTNDITISATAGGAGGEINTASNLATTGARVFSQKSGVDLQFRRLNAGTGVTVAEQGDSIVVTNTAPDQTVSITAGSNVSVSGTYPSFTISAASGETNTGSNLGAVGARVFAQKSGVDLQFRRVIAGSGISVTENANDLTIANTAQDQTVSLTAGANTTITGTYPNFTISSSATRLSSILPAIASNTIENSGNEQTWNWTSSTFQRAMSFRVTNPTRDSSTTVFISNNGGAQNSRTALEVETIASLANVKPVAAKFTAQGSAGVIAVEANVSSSSGASFAVRAEASGSYSNAFGVYAKSTGLTNAYGGYFLGQPFTSGGKTWGIYAEASNGALGNRAAQFNATGADNYSIWTDSGKVRLGYLTGTGAAFMKVDALGIPYRSDTAITGGGTTYTVSNGLTMVGSDIRLGGTLSGNTGINTGAFSLSLNGSGIPLFINTTGSTSASLSASGSVGLVSSSNQLPLWGIVQTTSNSGIISAFALNRTSAIVNNNAGVAYQVNLSNASNGNIVAALQEFTWADNTTGSESAQYTLRMIRSGAPAPQFGVAGSGAVRFYRYGVGTFSGTPTYILGTDGSGNVVETTVPSGSSAFAAKVNISPSTFYGPAYDPTTLTPLRDVLKVGSSSDNKLRTITLNAVYFVPQANFTGVGNWIQVATISDATYRPAHTVYFEGPSRIDATKFANSTGTAFTGAGVYDKLTIRIDANGGVFVYFNGITSYPQLSGSNIVVIPMHVTYFVQDISST